MFPGGNVFIHLSVPRFLETLFGGFRRNARVKILQYVEACSVLTFKINAFAAIGLGEVTQVWKYYFRQSLHFFNRNIHALDLNMHFRSSNVLITALKWIPIDINLLLMSITLDSSSVDSSTFTLKGSRQQLFLLLADLTSLSKWRCWYRESVVRCRENGAFNSVFGQPGQ